MTLLAEALFLVADTETSGQIKGIHSPVELGWVLSSNVKNLTFGDTLVNPGHKITNGAKAIHHILDEDVKDAPDLRTALKEHVAPSVAAYAIDAYVAHYAEFDSGMLPMLNKKPWLCTWRLAKKLLPHLEHYSNQFLRYELELDVPEAQGLPAHRALADAYVTAAILRKLIGMVIASPEWPDDLEGVLEKLYAPFLIEECPFPKHKDKKWEDVAKSDSQYMLWLLQPKEGQKPLESDMDYSIRFYLKKAGKL
jgi:exodeoxyribonuclease X